MKRDKELCQALVTKFRWVEDYVKMDAAIQRKLYNPSNCGARLSQITDLVGNGFLYFVNDFPELLKSHSRDILTEEAFCEFMEFVESNEIVKKTCERIALL